MKAIKKISIIFLSLIVFYACNDEDLNVDNPAGTAETGGLLDVKNISLNYVVGNPGPYSASLRVFQGAVKSTSVRIAKTFYTTEVEMVDGEEVKTVVVSNTVDNFKTIDITDTAQNSLISYEFTFPELVEGLSVAGTPLSSNDGDFTIGDYWEMQYFTTTSNGLETLNYATTQAAVSTRFAGTYTVLKGEYFRLGANNGAGAMWTGEKMVIKSIDATTYQWAEWGIVSGWAGNVLFFQIDPATSAITLPIEWDGVAQILNDQPIMTYPSDASNLTNVSGLTTDPNVATLVPNGKDQLDFVYGYLTAGSGPREFYHLLEKIVN
jgi:hypothetical protein